MIINSLHILSFLIPINTIIILRVLSLFLLLSFDLSSSVSSFNIRTIPLSTRRGLRDKSSQYYEYTGTPRTCLFSQIEKQQQLQQQHQIIYPTKEEEEEDMERKLAWAKHTVLTLAASIMSIPPDVLTTPPMVDPKPPSTTSERSLRREVNVCI